MARYEKPTPPPVVKTRTPAPMPPHPLHDPNKTAQNDTSQPNFNPNTNAPIKK